MAILCQSPVVFSFPTLSLQTEMIGIVDNHCYGMPPQCSATKLIVCVHVCERGTTLCVSRKRTKQKDGTDRGNQRETDVNMPRHLTFHPDHEEFVLVRSDDLFFVLPLLNPVMFSETLNCNIWFGGECCFHVRSSLKDKKKFLQHVVLSFLFILAGFTFQLVHLTPPC